MDRLDGSLALLLGGLLFVILAVSLVRAASLRRLAVRDVYREDRARTRDERALVASLEALLAQAPETAAAAAARVEAAVSRLAALLAQADRRIATLERQLAGSASGPPAAAAEAATDASDSRFVSDGQPPPAADGQGLGGLRSLRATVFALADAGHPVGPIAQATGLTVGEVEVILNLRAAAQRVVQVSG